MFWRAIAKDLLLWRTSRLVFPRWAAPRTDTFRVAATNPPPRCSEAKNRSRKAFARVGCAPGLMILMAKLPLQGLEDDPIVPEGTGAKAKERPSSSRPPIITAPAAIVGKNRCLSAFFLVSPLWAWSLEPASRWKLHNNTHPVICEPVGFCLTG